MRNKTSVKDRGPTNGHFNHRKRVSDEAAEEERSELHTVSMQDMLLRAAEVMTIAETRLARFFRNDPPAKEDVKASTIKKVLMEALGLSDVSILSGNAKPGDFIWVFHDACGQWHPVGSPRSLREEMKMGGPKSLLDILRRVALEPGVDAVMSFTDSKVEDGYTLALHMENRRHELAVAMADYNEKPFEVTDRRVMRSDRGLHQIAIDLIRIFPL